MRAGFASASAVVALALALRAAGCFGGERREEEVAIRAARERQAYGTDINSGEGVVLPTWAYSHLQLYRGEYAPYERALVASPTAKVVADAAVAYNPDMPAALER
ncbi:MAG TPA: hypothetical protein VHF22_06360, partial [Planctomycetota bacterium]|nr:hypothetical protein [Planctomycetota bacterium]